MAKSPKLAVIEGQDGYTYHVGWLVWDEEYGDDQGALLGESISDPDHRAATDAVKDMKDGRDSGGAFFWDSRLGAGRALKVAKEAVKAAAAQRPLPD